MTRAQRRARIDFIKNLSWIIFAGDADAAYGLTVVYVRRLREMGVVV